MNQAEAQNKAREINRVFGCNAAYVLILPIGHLGIGCKIKRAAHGDLESFSFDRDITTLCGNMSGGVCPQKELGS